MPILVKKRIRVRRQVLALDRKPLLPKVSIQGESAVLEYTYWNDWKGLVHAKVLVKRVGETVEFCESEEEILIEYVA